MQTDFIIVGQGLCGTWLSWWLEKMNQRYIVIDEGNSVSSSRIASGVINPVTGRVLAKTWLADSLLPFSLDAYNDIGQTLDIHCISEVGILHTFPTAQMRHVFEKKLPDLPEYLSRPANENAWKNWMDAPFGTGIIQPALLIDLNLLLNKWKSYLENQHLFFQEKFDNDHLLIKEDRIIYKDIEATKIIFCDGIGSMNLPWFGRLPFSPTKGEALLLEIDDLPATHIYKKGISIVPFPHFDQLAGTRYFWAGSSYEHEFENAAPTSEFRQRTQQHLANWLKIPFRVVDHWAAVRPATLERRPFAGMHPLHPRIGILNGTGTKGCSLAPWFGKQLADHLVHGTAIQPEASIERFAGILGA